MRPDQEIRQTRRLAATLAAIGKESLAGEEGSGLRDRFPLDDIAGERGFEVFDAGIANRDFGVDDGVDDNAAAICCCGEGIGRPVCPALVLRNYVEQHITVDHHGRHLFPPCEGHDGVRTHRHVTPAAHLRHEPRAAAGLAGGGDRDEANAGAVILESNFGIGHEAGADADLGGDGDLAFGGDAPGGVPNSYNVL